MSGIFVAVPFYSVNDVDSTITILVIGNYLGRVCENLKIMDL